jgi:catechol 2,3-dioxygenase-like lactoylglutathione lyase family enzyme
MIKGNAAKFKDERGQTMTVANARFLSVEPQFRVADVVKTAEFYRDVLGFRLEGYFGNPPVFTQVTRDGVTIQLGRSSDETRATPPPDGIAYNAYIWVDDVDALSREFRSKGADIIEEPVDRIYKCRELVVRDCNRLVLCFAKDIS